MYKDSNIGHSETTYALDVHNGVRSRCITLIYKCYSYGLLNLERYRNGIED